MKFMCFGIAVWCRNCNLPSSRLRRRLPIAALCFALFASSISITNVFPYAPFMVKHFGMTEDDADLGYYAGYLSSAYSLGSVLAPAYFYLLTYLLSSLQSTYLPKIRTGVARR